MSKQTEQLAERIEQGQIVQQADGPADVFGMVEQMRPQFARALSTALDPDRFVRVCLTVLRENPELRTCTRESLLAALMRCAQYALEPGPFGYVYLIPFHDRRRQARDVQWIVGYKGLILLAHRSGITVRAHVVYEHDQFEYELGDNEHITHRPTLSQDRGKAIAYYAIAEFDDGRSRREVLSRSDAEKVKAQYAKSKASPWHEHFDAMARKTVIRRLCNDLPLQAEAPLRQALDEDADTATMRAPADLELVAEQDSVPADPLGEVADEAGDDEGKDGPAGDAPTSKAQTQAGPSTLDMTTDDGDESEKK